MPARRLLLVCGVGLLAGCGGSAGKPPVKSVTPPPRILAPAEVAR